MGTNPLLNNLDLPHFAKIAPSDVVPAVTSTLKDLRARLADLEKNIVPSWEGALKPLEDMQRELAAVWGPVRHLLGVKNSAELRKAFDSVQGDMVEFSLAFSQSKPVYEALKQLQQSPDWGKLSSGQKRVVEKNLRDARLSGIELEGEQKARFNAIEKRLSELSTRFSNNVLDATKNFALTIREPKDMEGMPPSIKAMAAQSYNQRLKDGEKPGTPDAGPWTITLDAPSYIPFMQHCRNRELREKVYRANITRASSGEFNNAPLILEILRLRTEQAQLLGFKTYAELSLASKMAGTVAAVEKLEHDLLSAATKIGEREHAELQAFAQKKGFEGKLVHWDVPFYVERLREETYDYTDEELRPYFPLPKVLDGLFSLIHRLFKVKIQKSSADVELWHPDVRYYDVVNEKSQKIAGFYLDPFSRPENKRGGAWMDTCIDRGFYDGRLYLPVAYVICNGTPPVGEQPSLLTFSDVQTLFHEFGHALQHMLTKVDHYSASGINGVEWDAVELPSQFMENWCYHEPTLMGLTEHISTKEPLPHSLFEKIKSAKNYRSATAMLRQLHFGMIDIELHHRFDRDQDEKALWETNRKVAEKVVVLPPLPEDRFLCSFSHIFAGGYAAGYYSYKWAEVLSSDAFSAFEEAGLDDEKAVASVGTRFRDTVLALGGSEHPSDVFRKFRGRNPETKALLRHSGLLHEQTAGA